MYVVFNLQISHFIPNAAIQCSKLQDVDINRDKRERKIGTNETRKGIEAGKKSLLHIYADPMFSQYSIETKKRERKKHEQW